MLLSILPTLTATSDTIVTNPYRCHIYWALPGLIYYIQKELSIQILGKETYILILLLKWPTYWNPVGEMTYLLKIQRVEMIYLHKSKRWNDLLNIQYFMKQIFRLKIFIHTYIRSLLSITKWIKISGKYTHWLGKFNASYFLSPSCQVVKIRFQEIEKPQGRIQLFYVQMKQSGNQWSGLEDQKDLSLWCFVLPVKYIWLAYYVNYDFPVFVFLFSSWWYSIESKIMWFMSHPIFFFCMSYVSVIMEILIRC